MSHRIERVATAGRPQVKLPSRATPRALAEPLVASLDCNQERFPS